MTATDELRRMLDERGVEWSSPSGLNKSFADSITFIGDVAVVSEIDGSDLLRINFDGTPEQAIAATIGADAKPTQEESSGTLSAEQVRDAVMLADRLKKPMGNTGLTNTHLIVRDDGWQAIADELNATLGRGTCHDVYPQATYCFTCSECGHVRRFIQGWNNTTDSEQSEFRFCPNCGRKVVADGQA